jgi:hypothetical protein
MKKRRRSVVARCFVSIGISLLVPAIGKGQDAAASPVVTPGVSMSVFAGVYAYRGGVTVAIVPKNGALVAVVDEALYPLQWTQGDAFKNGGGQPVAFRRAANGLIEGLVEGKDYFSRLSATVPTEIVTLALATPRSGNGYLYQSPPFLDDGIKVGPAAAAGFDETALESGLRGENGAGQQGDRFAARHRKWGAEAFYCPFTWRRGGVHRRQL